MKTIIKKIDEDNFIKEELSDAAQFLRNGGLVAFPTETVYGLGANALDSEAAERIYEAKGRPSDNPLIIHIAEYESLSELASVIPPEAKLLSDKFWPGPLTMILQKSEAVPIATTGGLETVAIRMPGNKIALELIRQSGLFLAAPSANTSGKPSPTRADHVNLDLNGKVEMIIDGGAVGIGLESTIIDLTAKIPTILRPGYITKAMLEEVIGTVVMDEAILNSNKDRTVVAKAPGMKYKHYAPKGQLIIFEGDSELVIEEINKRAKSNEKEKIKVGIIATDETKEQYKYGMVKTIGSRTDEEVIAKGLYALLREFDDLEASYIYSESFMDDDLGQAIMNRLLKAAGYNVINVSKENKDDKI